MAAPKIMVKMALGSLVTAYQSAQEALKEEDWPRMCRWMSVAMQGEQALLQALKGLAEETQDKEIKRFVS